LSHKLVGFVSLCFIPYPPIGDARREAMGIVGTEVSNMERGSHFTMSPFGDFDEWLRGMVVARDVILRVLRKPWSAGEKKRF
jgi:hypothetical protein